VNKFQSAPIPLIIWLLDSDSWLLSLNSSNSSFPRLRPRLRKDPTGHSVWVWYEDPDLLRCHQAPIHAELPS
jgi:hypothetical protein